MLRPLYLVVSVYSLLGLGCTAEVRPETPHEARAERHEERREEKREEKREERREEREHDHHDY